MIFYSLYWQLFQVAPTSGNTNKTAAVVLLLVEPLLKKGHRLWMISNLMGGEGQKKKRLMTHGQGNEIPVPVIDYNKPMGRVDLKDQPLQWHLLERKKMTIWYIKMVRKLLSVTIQSCMNVLCKFRPVQNRQSLWSPSLTTQIQSNTTIWYKLYILNMGVKLKGKHKAVIPLTKICCDFLTAISPERIQPTEKKARPTKRFVVLQTRQCFGTLIFRLHFVLKAVSRHSIPS